MHTVSGGNISILDILMRKVTISDDSLVNCNLLWRPAGNSMCLMTIVFHSGIY
jgi:hypothetical protein